MTEYPKCPDCGGEIVIHELTDEYWHVRLFNTNAGVMHELAGIRDSFLRENKRNWQCFECERVFSKEEIQKLKEKSEDEQRENND